MKSMMRLIVLSSLSSACAVKIAVDGSNEITTTSRMGKHLMQHARRLEDNVMDYSFVSEYAIKFQGCHHISQWNDEADDEDDVRIQTKRLIRFRLCPANYCSDSNTAGCSKGYGDYVVDMNTFVYSYVTAMDEEREYKCALHEDDCENTCDNADDDCMATCYESYGVTGCNGEDAFNVLNYAKCAQYDFDNQGDDAGRRLEEADGYYVGPYCADQGGEVHLGLFSDDTCTTFVSGGKNVFYTYTNMELPYASENVIPTSCMSCADGYGDDDDVNQDDMNYANDLKEVCEDIYLASGKCESKMSLDYPNEAACTYIEGIKIIREDGVIRTTSTKKSKIAAVSIGLFTTIAVILGAYVYYLRTKLGRAKINLSTGTLS